MSEDFSQYLERKNNFDTSAKELQDHNHEFRTISSRLELIFSGMQKELDKFEKTKSVITKSSSTSGSTRSSLRTMIERKAKAEAAKTSLEFSKKEAELKKIEAEM